MLESLPSDHPEKAFLERIGRQFGFNLLVLEEDERLILKGGEGKAEIFRRLTFRRGTPSTHNSSQLLGPKSSFWEEKPKRHKRR